MGLFDFLFGSDESSNKQWGPRKFSIFGESGGIERFQLASEFCAL